MLRFGWCCLLFVFHSFGQAQEFTFFSIALQSDRSIQVYLPKSYDSTRAYPVMYVLDGNYVGGIAHETNEFLSYFERSFPCITVAIRQDSTRWEDCGYSWKNNDYTPRGKQFLEYLSEEVPQFVTDRYKTTAFSILVGHSYTASYACLDWCSDSAHFSEYIALSPYLPTEFLEKMLERNHLTSKSITVISSSADLSGHRMGCFELEKRLKKEITSRIAVQNVGDKTHSTLVPVGLEVGLNRVFQPMQSCFNAYSDQQTIRSLPIITKDSLLQRYTMASSKFGVTISPKVEDIEFALMTLQTHKRWSHQEELSKWAMEQFPNNYVGYYGLAAIHEHRKQWQEALALYEKGYAMLGEEILNKTDFYRDIERVQKHLK